MINPNIRPAKPVMSQPAPTPNDRPATWDLVIAECESWASPDLIARMRARDAKGLATYGVRLQSHNGRDSLEDAMDEILDFMVYVKNGELEATDDQDRRDFVDAAWHAISPLSELLSIIKRREQAGPG